MGRTVSIGAQGFASLREHNCFYVDKTDFIRDWWESEDNITLITRPRRFGKTLNMNMLECFFSTKYRNRGDLFEGLKIWEDEKYRQIQGTWPVIFLTFADIKGANYKNTRDGIISSLTELYRKHDYLLRGNALTEQEKQCFYSLGQAIPDNADIMDFITDNTIARSVKNLAEWMNRYHKKNVIILLDEYDTPMQEAYLSGYWDELTALIRSLFNSTFKTNPYLERAVMSGITRVSKESIFSDLNNLKVVTVTSDSYATAFGFTEEEVFASLDEQGLSDEKQKVKAWYDGFTFGNHTDIYNPWSITCFLDEKKYNTYWANTSGNRLVSRLIREGSAELKKTMEALLSGETLRCAIDEQFVYSQLGKKRNAIWSLLLSNGYLKVITAPVPDGDTNRTDYNYELGLTNHEVFLMFCGLISDWFAESEDSCNDFIKALMKSDREEALQEMNIFMNSIALASFSFFDTGNQPSGRPEPERFYHGFVLGLLVELRGQYLLRSNRESGYGRYDVLLEPLKPGEPAFILEFKVHDPKKEATLEDTVAVALKQIEDRHYATELEEKGIALENIRKYGFAFEGKTVLIG